MRRREFQFFAVLQSSETTSANPFPGRIPSLLNRRLGMGFYPDETL